jgi:predicted nucleic acid-binding protein
MNSQEYILLDTNCLGYFLNGQRLELDLVGNKKIVIYEITEMEIQCDKQLTAPERKLLKMFLGGITIIYLNETIRDLAVKIRLTTSMKLMDSIIAATSQYLSLPMLITDDKFETVKTTNVILLPSIQKR